MTLFGAAAHELGPEDTYGVWMIDDTENSFLTQPFWIRYARQDVYLSTMITFNLSDSKHEVVTSFFFFCFPFFFK